MQFQKAKSTTEMIVKAQETQSLALVLFTSSAIQKMLNPTPMKKGTSKSTATKTYHQSNESLISLKNTCKKRRVKRAIVRRFMKTTPHLIGKQQQHFSSTVSSVEQWQTQQQQRQPSSSRAISARVLTLGSSGAYSSSATATF